MLIKSNRNKAFTIIELIVVISIVGILVLLALSLFLGYTESARLSHIKNDVKAHENAIEAERIKNESYIDEWISISTKDLKEFRDSETLFDKKGLVKKDYEFNDEYFIIESNLVKSKLDGDFIIGKDGKVFYHDENFNSGKENEDYYYAQDDDFRWIHDSDDPHSYIGVNGEKGYFEYIGSTDKMIEIPHIIQGVSITSYHRMFEDVDGLLGVKSENESIVSTSYMFHNIETTKLNISKLDMSNVSELSSMLDNVKANSINAQGWNLNNVELTYLFSYIEAEHVNISGWIVENSDASATFYNVMKDIDELKLKVDMSYSSFVNSDVSSMFVSSSVYSVDMSHMVANNINMYGMFGSSKILFANMSNMKADGSNMSSMFSGINYETPHLLSIDMSSMEANNGADMYGMFSSSKVLFADMSDMRANDSNMSGMFSGINYETPHSLSIDMSNMESNNADMGGMFNGAKISSADMSNMKADGSNMGGMFGGVNGGNTHLLNVDMSSMEANNGADMGGMFSGTKISSVDMSNMKANDSNMSGMFSGINYNIYEATIIMDNISLNNSNASSMFGGSYIKTLSLENAEMNVAILSGMFSGAKIEALNAENAIMEHSDLGSMFGGAEANIVNLRNSKMNNANVSHMFSGLKTNILNLEDTSFKESTMDGTFSYGDIGELIAEGLSTENVSNMNWLFHGITIDVLDLTSFDFLSVEKMDDMFSTATIKTIYVKSEEDKELLNQTIEEHNTLEIIIKK